MNYSLYFQARVTKELCWLLSATLKYCEGVTFDRAFDKNQGIFEFFVSPDLEDSFLDMMEKLEKRGVVSDIQKMENRLR